MTAQMCFIAAFSVGALWGQPAPRLDCDSAKTQVARISVGDDQDTVESVLGSGEMGQTSSGDTVENYVLVGCSVTVRFVDGKVSSARFLKDFVPPRVPGINSQGPGTSAPEKPRETLVNADVITLAKAGLPADVLISKINSTGCRFQLDVEGLLALKQATVPDQVVRAMLARNCGSENAILTVPPRPTETQHDNGDGGKKVGNVSIGVTTNVMDGTKAAVLTVGAGAEARHPAELSLIFASSAKQPIMVYLDAGGVAEAADHYGSVVKRVKFDDENPIQATWIRGSNYKGLVLVDTAALAVGVDMNPFVIDFVTKVLASKRVYVEIPYFAEGTAVVEFNTADFRAALTQCPACLAVISALKK
jgi:hypothetical protein